MERLFSMLENSAIAGRSGDWSKLSEIREFIQPWYSPLPVIPESTGMALGGIGSSFTLNPCGRTVALQFLAGTPVLNDADGVELQDFYFSERSTRDDVWKVVSPGSFLSTNFFYPLLRSDGTQWIAGSESAPQLEAALKAMLAAEDLVAVNAARLNRWALPLRTPTARLMEASPEVRNARALAELFGESICIGNPRLRSLIVGEGRRNGVQCFTPEAQYRAQFPAIGFTYAETGFCRIQRVSFSPVVASGRDTDLPVTVTHFSIDNPGAHAKTVTLVWLGENLNGYRHVKMRPGYQDAAHKLLRTPAHHVNRTAAISGVDACVLLSSRRRTGGVHGCTAMAVAAPEGAVRPSVRANFFSSHCETTVRTAANAGVLAELHFPGDRSSTDGLFGAVAITADIPSGGHVEFTCYLVLDYPDLRIGDSALRKHSRELNLAEPGADARARSVVMYAAQNATRMADEVAAAHDRLEACVAEKLGQQPADLRRQVCTMMTAMLSNLCESSLWAESGQFLVRECLDYPFYNSLDVYFYGSFGLAHLLPHIDQGCVQAFIEAAIMPLPAVRHHWRYVYRPRAEGAAEYAGPRKPAMTPPHDLGSPFDAVPNAYTYHYTGRWLDLTPKLVLLVYRSYELTRDRAFLQRVQEAVAQLMDHAAAQLEPGQALPWSKGVSNTYDNLSATGTQVYNAQLWIASLEAYVAMRRILEVDAGSASWSSLCERARRDLFERLWDPDVGRFNYNTGPVLNAHLRREGERELAARLGECGLACSVGVAEALNRLLYAAPDDDVPWRCFQALCGPDIGQLRAQPKSKRIAGAKRALLKLGEGLWADGFAEYADVESDMLFADQLIGDFYLRKLGLRPICSAEQTKAVLYNLYRTSFVQNSPIVGIPNLVRADGASLKEFQAQDVWLGVNFTIAELMREEGLHREYAHVMGQIFEIVYHFARIPFGIPEGFNCTHSNSAADGVVQREIVERLLQHSRAISTDPSALAASPGFESNVRCPLFTAGRYMRPGSIFSLLW